MRKATTLLAIVASVLFYAFAFVTVASADPGGNNGDVKIHDTTTAVEDHRNEPHVCSFYIDGFNFDGGSSGTWRIERWAPTGSGVQDGGSWGPADSKGDWHSATMTLPNGHYKLFFKETDTPGGEKQKVFWVECPGQSGGTQSGGTDTGGTQGGGTATGGTQTTCCNGITIFTPGNSAESNGSSNGSNGAVRGVESAPNGNAVGAVSPIVELPGGSNQLPTNAVQGAQSAPLAGIQGLPSTSTESSGAPLTLVGLAIIGLGGALLRRSRV